MNGFARAAASPPAVAASRTAARPRVGGRLAGRAPRPGTEEAHDRVPGDGGLPESQSIQSGETSIHHPTRNSPLGIRGGRIPARSDDVDGSSTGRTRRAGLGSSAPSVARWLGDIRGFFPTSVVRVLQQDAMDRLGLRQLLLEPEILETVEADVHLVADLLALAGVIPARAKETARIVVRKCVAEVERRLAEPLRQAVIGALNRAVRIEFLPDGSRLPCSPPKVRAECCVKKLSLNGVKLGRIS